MSDELAGVRIIENKFLPATTVVFVKDGEIQQILDYEKEIQSLREQLERAEKEIYEVYRLNDEDGIGERYFADKPERLKYFTDKEAHNDR